MIETELGTVFFFEIQNKGRDGTRYSKENPECVTVHICNLMIGIFTLEELFIEATTITFIRSS